MKTKITLSVILAAAAIFILMDRPSATAETTPSTKLDAAYPLNCECVVTVENQAWMATVGTQTPGPPSGFRADFTIQGKLILFSPDWIVIKDGTYENWISRDKVVNLRASR